MWILKKINKTYKNRIEYLITKYPDNNILDFLGFEKVTLFKESDICKYMPDNNDIYDYYNLIATSDDVDREDILTDIRYRGYKYKYNKEIIYEGSIVIK